MRIEQNTMKGDYSVMKVGRTCVYVYFLVIIVILGCNQSRDWGEITFMVTDLSGDSKKPIVFKGPNVTYHENYIKLTEGEGRYAEEYLILPQHAVEDKRYIYVPLANAGGGTGIFNELQAIDKETMKTTDYAILGDRVKIRSVSIGKDGKITVEYQERSLSGEPGNIVTNHYEMHKGKLRQDTEN